MVRIYSDVGECRLPASVTSRLTPGSCVLHKGVYWLPDPKTGIDMGGNSNVIMTDKACASKMYANMYRVEVEKL